MSPILFAKIGWGISVKTLKGKGVAHATPHLKTPTLTSYSSVPY